MKSLSISIKEGLESFNLDLPIYNEVIKLFDASSKKEWSNRLNYLYNIVTPQWTRVYKRNIPVNKEDGRLYMILKFYPVGSILFDKGLTGELYIGFNNKKCYKVVPAWKSGDLDSEKYGKKFAGIKCIKLDKKINDIELDHNNIENIYIMPNGFNDIVKLMNKLSKQ